MQSHEFTFWGPWTNETHCHFILSALKTPLLDENIPDSGYIKYIIIGPKPDCQLGNIYLLKIFLFFHSTGFHSGPFQDHSSPNSRMALFCWNKWYPEWQFWQGTLPNIIPLDSGRNHRGMIKTSCDSRWKVSTIGHLKGLVCDLSPLTSPKMPDGWNFLSVITCVPATFTCFLSYLCTTTISNHSISQCHRHSPSKSHSISITIEL